MLTGGVARPAHKVLRVDLCRMLLCRCLAVAFFWTHGVADIQRARAIGPCSRWLRYIATRMASSW